MNFLNCVRSWKSIASLIVFIVIGIITIGRVAQAQSISVPNDFSTIQAAINVANTGDIVLVAPGTYAENINFNGKNIIVKSTDGAEKTVIDGNLSGSVVTFVNEETATLSGFTLTNGSGTLLDGSTHGGGIYVKNANPTLENLIILNNSVTSSGGGIHFEQSDTILSKSIIRNNLAGDDGGGISTVHSNVTIKNCLIVENEAKNSGGVVAGGGIRIHGYGNPTIINSTIANNSTPGSGGGIMVYWNTSPVITNSIVYNNIGGEIKASSNANPVVTYSIVKGGYTGEGNIDSDPLFENGYHLSDNSLAIDAGTPIDAPETDLEGNSIPSGGGYDMGVYEKVYLYAEERRILQTINQFGYAYVIIDLHVNDYQAEGFYDSPEGVSEQRARVANAQVQFINSLSQIPLATLRAPGPAPENFDEFLISIDTFTTVPQVFMKINMGLFAKIIKHPLVTNIWLNVADSVSLSETTKIVGATTSWEKDLGNSGGYTGNGQYIVVLDTGVDSSHPALVGGKVVEGACFSFVSTKNESKTCSANSIANGQGLDVGIIYEESRDAITGNSSYEPSVASPCQDHLEYCEHGTHVAGIIAANDEEIQGVAKDAKIIAIQAGTTNTDGLSVNLYRYSQQKALEYVYLTLAGKKGPYEGKIAAVNMSLNEKKDMNGVPYLYDVFCDGLSYDSRKRHIDNLYSYGIATIISSGNDGKKGQIASPACISSAISVGATGCGKDSNGNFIACTPDKIKNNEETVWKWSNSSEKLDLLAPGVEIKSTWLGEKTEISSGTSQAAPHVAGAWAILKQKWDSLSKNKDKHPKEAVDEILEALVVTGIQIQDTNGIIKPRIQIDKALDALNSSSKCEVHAKYMTEEKLVSIPFLDIPLLEPLTQVPTGEVAIARMDLSLIEGANDFKVIPDSLKVKKIALQFSECHANYDYKGILYIPNLDVQELIILPPNIIAKSVIRTYEATLYQLPLSPDVFHLKEYTLLSSGTQKDSGDLGR